MKITFVTGNQNKVDQLVKFLGTKLEHHKLELDEIQSLDLRKITEHKARQAYDILNSPILVEDVSLSFRALGLLPGPFIKWFEKEIGLDGICRLLDPYKDKSATASVTFAYYDGAKVVFFEGMSQGTITNTVRPGDNSFGWNSIFVPDGQSKAFVEMNDEEQERYGLRSTTVFPQIRKFLNELDK